MNLFVVGSGVSLEERASARSALLSQLDTHAYLAPDTFTELHGGHTYAAWLHWPPPVAAPRRYAHVTADEAVIYDGTPVDPTGRIEAHDAADLARHWEALDQTLEGRFAAFRIRPVRDEIDFINDPLGAHPLFELRSPTTSWMSNSARVLVRLQRSASLDLAAAAEFLSLGTAIRDRTPFAGVTAVAAAQCRRWPDAAPGQENAYFGIPDLVRQRRRPFTPAAAAALAEELGGALRHLSAAFGEIECPITAGRDSRMMLGLMLANALPGRYFSGGDPDGPDIRIGASIARRFGLPHEETVATDAALVAEAPELTRRVIEANDGTVTLAHIANAFGWPAQLECAKLQLYGAGGELARGYMMPKRYAFAAPTARQAVKDTVRVQRRDAGLLRVEVAAAVRAGVERRCWELLDAGFEPTFLPQAFDLLEQNRRWTSAQARQIAGHADVFMPFMTRPYARAAFTVPARELAFERIPYLLVDHLSPDLRSQPLDHAWAPQQPALALAAWAADLAGRLGARVRRRVGAARPLPPGRTRERVQLLDRLLPMWRNRVLDSDAALWQVIDRARFEWLTSEDVPSAGRRSANDAVFRVVTLFFLQTDLEHAVAASSVRRHDALASPESRA